jgi:ACS family hexuronate transporter-like MFS transporter
VVQRTHSYVPLFLVCGVAYVTALAILHALSPRLAPAKLEGVPPARP